MNALHGQAGRVVSTLLAATILFTRVAFESLGTPRRTPRGKRFPTWIYRRAAG